MKGLSLKWLKEYNLLIYEEVDSTNSEALRLAKAGVDGNFVIWAQSQTHGRGRNGRAWLSAKENLFTSILLSPDCKVESLPQLSFVTSLAVHDALSLICKQHKVSASLSLKWPNDILINEAKVAGILLESINVKTFKRNYLVIGIGININNKPELEGRTITCLKDILGADIEPGYVFDKVLAYFDLYYKKWQNDGFIDIRKTWLKKAHHLNNVVTIDSGHNRVSGIFKDIDFSGAIRIKLACGRIYSLHAGEVFF
ncbi:MAG: biotin--protein ligase [Rickettsiaceae bacterium]|jgi:BirA family biotin operon repressor/biotin-[acetyl-CoA-carboxylase] ligase|nr:biotin--protein ligase [Rickettsiaceae bacterium]